MEPIQKKVTINFQTLLKAKLWRFTRKSWWLLLLASAMLAAGWQDIFPEQAALPFVFRFACIAAVTLLLDLVLIYLSAKLQAARFRERKWLVVIDAQGISFSDEQSRQPVSWSWEKLKGCYRTSSQWVFHLPMFPQYLFLSHQKLTQEEQDKLQQWAGKRLMR